MRNTFKQAISEPVSWLVRLWDRGASGISLTAVEAEKPELSNLILRQRLYNLKQRSQCLVERRIGAIRNTWLSPSEVSTNSRGWRATEEDDDAIEGAGNKRSCV